MSIVQKYLNFLRFCNFWIFIFFCENIFTSCAEGSEEFEIIAFESNLESKNLEGIYNGRLLEFQSKFLLGPYNNDGFFFYAYQLNSHRYLKITFDLYIHDSWDGNYAFPDGPDLWLIKIDGQEVFRTTFSNDPSRMKQSYPGTFPDIYDPRTGSILILPGLCLQPDKPNGTTVYKFEIKVAHNLELARIEVSDLLTQPNSGNPLCDESWSVGNIKVSTIGLK
ncbi:MAG: hypothetical protein FJZ78_01180 [Bacteroidetes bacterium]|nr:hypothetical protein [Bacteroidota bacterium]